MKKFYQLEIGRTLEGRMKVYFVEYLDNQTGPLGRKILHSRWVPDETPLFAWAQEFTATGKVPMEALVA
jgi:hypothetical protein